MRFFNTAGPVKPEIHYCIPPLESFNYKEAGPQIGVQAFLPHIVNGRDFIGREYALGRKRTDLLVRWRIPDGEQRVVIELKVSQEDVERTIAAGLPQT